MFAPGPANYRFRLEVKGRGNKRRGVHVKPGIQSEITSPEFEFGFNLRGEIKTIRGLGPHWPHPFEYLKRTEGNDWVYYTVGEDSTDKGIISWFGEYYLPCLPYPSNSIFRKTPFSDPNIMMGMGAFSQLFGDLHGMQQGVMPDARRAFVERVLTNDDNRLHEKAAALDKIIGTRVSVLPPDARLVDYEMIPLMVADGCLYNCRFCRVKSGSGFKTRSRDEIDAQISRLKDHYGPDLVNMNAVFLGNHDALAADSDTLLHAATRSLEVFGLAEQGRLDPRFFLFGSVDSLLRTEDKFLDALNALPVTTFINIGFESVDDPTLKQIGKPLRAARVMEAFQRMRILNRRYPNIEVSGNFLIGEGLSDAHETSLRRLLSDSSEPVSKKGTIYLSPLVEKEVDPSVILDRFRRIQAESRLPVFVYLIQRL